tara:strand:- start:133 stop:390 length:258 start_codon:yes stop_codon:yes gene_type:complete
MNILEKDSYRKQIDKSYYLALRDLLSGVSYQELIEDLVEFEKKEYYELCAGIFKALKQAKNKTYNEIKKEVETYEKRRKKEQVRY